VTTIAFTPNNSTAPPFQALVTLDGQTYTMSTRWSVYRTDWMVSLTDQSNNLIMNMPLIGSPPNFDIPLFPGLLRTSTILYRVASSSFEVTP
jgi:hypothetical protein